MPRNAESFESQVLNYFRTASAEKVEMLFGFIRPIVKARVQATPKKVTRKKADKQQVPGDAAVGSTATA